MSEPRKPIFGFLWPKPDPNAPTDQAFHQVRLLRATSRGVIRVLALAVLTLTTIAFVGSALLAALTTRALAPTLISAAIGATLVVLVMRGWIVGTYVNDETVRIETTWRRHTIPMSSVVSTVEIDKAPVLGLPLFVRAQRVHLVLAGGGTVPTHVYATSPDVWPSREAYDVASARLAHWVTR